jgi:hypothetical protein
VGKQHTKQHTKQIACPGRYTFWYTLADRLHRICIVGHNRRGASPVRKSEHATFFGVPSSGHFISFPFRSMTTRELRRIVRNYYRAQGGTRPAQPVAVAHPVPGKALDITLIVIFILLGIACMF